MSAIHVFFFRGLSTYGSDDAKWSFLDFGPMHKHVQRAFAQREVEFHPVLGMGAGSLPEVAGRARRFLDQHPVWQNPKIPVHFFGHSAGGLVARLLLQDEATPLGKVLSCMTVASPHRGSRLAKICIDMPETHIGSTRILRALGYNITGKNEFFEELTPHGLHTVFANGPESGNLRAGRVASLVCSAPRREWCLPLRLFYKLRAINDFDVPSDGLIERETQPFGEVIAELKIDHFRQLGLFGQPHRFNQLCEVLYDFFKSTQKQS